MSLARMATPYCAVGILLLSALCQTIQGYRDVPKDGSESVRAVFDLLSADALCPTSWEEFQSDGNPLLEFLGGSVIKTRKKCKQQCNDEDFEGVECKGRFRSKCRTRFPIANGKVKATEIDTCVGTFHTHARPGNGTFWSRNTCEGFRTRRDHFDVKAGYEDVFATSTWRCGLFNSEEVTFTENPFDLRIQSFCGGSQDGRIIVIVDTFSAPAPAPSPTYWMGAAQTVFADMLTGNSYLEMRNGAGGSTQLLQTVDTTCNGVNIPSTVPCRGLYELTIQSGNGILEKKCSGSLTPIVENQDVVLELISNCQGQGRTAVSVEGSVLSMTTTDSCTADNTMSVAFAETSGQIVGGYLGLCLGNSTSTQHFSEAKDTQPVIV